MVRVPLDLLAPDDAAVDDGGHLAIAAAEIEADAAAVEVPAERRAVRIARVGDPSRRPPRSGARGRARRRCTSRSARRALAEVSAQPLIDQRGGGVEVDAEAAARPERELDQALEHAEVGGGGGVIAREQVGPEARDGASALLERDAHPDRAPGVRARCSNARRASAAGRKLGSSTGTTAGKGNAKRSSGLWFPIAKNLGSRRARSSCQRRAGVLERRAVERVPARRLG